MAADAVINHSEDRDIDFNIGAFDGKKIWCRLNKAEDGKATKAVVLSHGLTGHPNEYIHMMARNYFTVRGYDVYRFAYYNDGDDYRTLTDCTLDIHGKDLNSVIGFVQQSYEKVFVCGHSYGGLTMLFAQPQVAAVSFWDSSFLPYDAFWKHSAEYVPELNSYSLKWECEFKVGKAMVEEAKALTAEKAISMAATFKAPSLVVLAGDSTENAGATRLHDSLCCEKALHDVEGADHCFTKGDTVFGLLEETYNWFERF